MEKRLKIHTNLDNAIDYYDSKIIEGIKEITSLKAIDDNETYKTAKNFRAAANKEVKRINDEAKKILTVAEEQMNYQIDKELTGDIKNLDKLKLMIEDYEKEYKRQKEMDCKIIFNQLNDREWLKYETMAKKDWLNQTYTLNAVTNDIKEIVEKVTEELKFLSFEEKKEYEKTLDLNGILRKRIENEKHSLIFKITGKSQYHFDELIDFMNKNDFEFEMITK